MKIFLYSPYIPEHFGGGEKYLLDIARTLAANPNHQVNLAISIKHTLSAVKLKEIKYQYEQYFSYNLKKVKFVSTPLGSNTNFFRKLFWTKHYDLGYYLTDGSLFFSMAKKNILHVQVPLKLDKSSFIEKKKLQSWNVITTNSNFTKSIIEPSWNTKVTQVHQPMIEVDQLIAQSNFDQKEKIILNVGRFFPQLHSKRQDILVTIFKRLFDQYKKDLDGWRLVLIGTVEDDQYARRVAKLAKGYPITLNHQAARAEVLKWYQKSSIYWHATGYRINELDEPHKVEHFGISTVEAMASGNVPLVIAKGGQKEVIGDQLLDWSWLTQRECIKKTRQVIVNEQLRQKLQKQAQQQSRSFSPQVFISKLNKLISN